MRKNNHFKRLHKPKAFLSGKSNRRGIAIIWVTIFLLLLILIVGASLDSAKVYLVANQLQNAADAAALAGGRIVRIDQNQARLQAKAIGEENLADRKPVVLNLNLGNNLSGDIVVGRYIRSTKTFEARTDAVNAMKIVARRTEDSADGPVRLNFGPVVRINNANVATSAIAIASGGFGAGLIALSDTGTGLKINGNCVVDVNDGAIQVNSVDDNAVRIMGQPVVHATELNVTGKSDPTGGFEFEPGFILNEGAPPIPDPLCPFPPVICLPPPTWDPINDLSPAPGETIQIDDGNHVFEPGFYSGGFKITGGNIAFKPGIYVLDGGPNGFGGLIVGGEANFCAKGVMFYVTGTASVDLTGTGYIRVTPMILDSNDFCDPAFAYPPGADIVTYEGTTIFQDRTNYNEARIIGTNMLDLDGTLYFPNNHAELGGTGDGFGNQLIAWTVEVHGTGVVGINYDGRNFIPANKSFLVE